MGEVEGHCSTLPASLASEAMAWADRASEAELKAYALAAARRITPAAREAFILYMRVA